MLDAVLHRLALLHPQVIDLSLERMQRLLADLGNPQNTLPPVIHLAGTNGKGSTLATLRAICETAGLRVHAYTSPHLVRFAERIRVAGHLLDDPALMQVLAEVEHRNLGQPITFFESTTAAAFLAFATTPADVCLLETGLGGRLDATNVVDRPAATVLTAIDLDHQDYLGHTLAEIAREKAHILRPGVPAIVARQANAALHVIERHAAHIGAPLWRQDHDWWAEPTPTGFTLRIPQLGVELTAPPPLLPGQHQMANAALALATAIISGLVAVNNDLAAQALANVSWPGRLQHLTSGNVVEELGRNLWLDGGHNPSAGQAIAPTLAAWANHGPVDLILGMQTTKDPAGYLLAVAPYVRSLRCVTVASAPAPFAAADLAAIATAQGHTDCQATPDWQTALRDLRPAQGRILIAGSLYLVGDVLAANQVGCPD